MSEPEIVDDRDPRDQRPLGARPQNEPAHMAAMLAPVVMAVAIIGALGSVLAGLLLIFHSEGLGHHHPFVFAGFGVMIGGLLQATVTMAVAYLCEDVRNRLRSNAP